MAGIRLLAQPEEIDELIERSKVAPVWIFKHSLTCGTSSAARTQYQSFVAERPEDDGITYAMVEIQNARPVSQAVAEKTGLRHESPQILQLKDGKVAWHASHWRIRKEALAEAL